MMAEHTPGPWEFVETEDFWHVRDERGNVLIGEDLVAHYTPTPETARRMVEQLNSQADLLAACKAFAEMYRNADLGHEDECRRLYGIVSRAIARAEPRP